MTFKLLDVFAGMGGWSIGFYREGFECIGIDLVDVGYPYRLVLADVKDYCPKEHFDVVVESPPCTEFSHLTMLSYKRGQRGPPDPDKGIQLVKEGIRIKDEVKPVYWVIENVYGAIPYLQPLLGKPMLLAKPWVLWGNLPNFMFDFEPRRRGDTKMSHTFEHTGKGGDIFGKAGGRTGIPEDFAWDPLRSWKRARIPVFLSQVIAKVVKGELTKYTAKEEF